MKKITIISLLIVIAIALSILVYTNYIKSGYNRGEISTQSTEIVVEDSLGRKITLKTPVERIIVTDDEVAELIQLLGAADKVIGIEPSIKKRGYFPLMADKAVTGSQFRGLNYELVAQLKPDLVIMMDVGPITKIIDKLDEIGIKSIVISIKPWKIIDTIKLLGKVLGKEDRAKELINWWNNKWHELEEMIKPYVNKTVITAYVGKLFKPTDTIPLRTQGKDAKWNYIFWKLGITNIADKILESRGNIDPEYLIQEDPDIIIIADYSDNYVGYLKDNSSLADEFLTKILLDEKYAELTAFKEKRVFVIQYVMLGSFRSVVGAYYLAKVIYPEAMKNVDPDEIHKEYFEKWLEEPYKGIWFYPRPWLGESIGG